ncbi:hypothetical protein M3Y94_00026800 [Aphelenchoides besseyi]|nr:hypothetical protein M3Y94_00026800 [Aphelenchoides besseyi]KAI6217247.1 hypothetical protein M3Y95_01230300 [Aphelenchoides besseyi]
MAPPRAYHSREFTANSRRRTLHSPVNRPVISRSHKCPVCSVSFRTSQGLEFHLRTSHSGVKEANRVVETHQRNEQRRSNEFNSSRRVDCVSHQTERPVPLNEVNVEEHRRKIEFHCYNCDKMVAGNIFAHNLWVHWKLRSLNGGVFACSHCDFRSRVAQTRDSHVQLEHPGVQLKDFVLHEHHRTMYFCWLCPAFCPTDVELFEHCKREHSNAENWDRWIANYERRTGKKIAVTEDFTLEHTDCEHSNEARCYICKLQMQQADISEHLYAVHLRAREGNEIYWRCPICTYKTKIRNVRDTHVCSRHSINARVRLPNGDIRKEFNCRSCASTFEVQDALINHMIESHGPRSRRESKAESLEQLKDHTSELQSSNEEVAIKQEVNSIDSDYELPMFMHLPAFTSSMRPIKSEPESENKIMKRKSQMESTSAKKSKPVEEMEVTEESNSNTSTGHPHHVVSFAKSLPQGNSSIELDSIQMLATAMFQQPSVIYYDYQMLHSEYGTLPIKLWKATAECKVLFLRLQSNQWEHEPELDGPLVVATLPRFNAPRNVDRRAFLLGFVKTTAEDMAEILLAETNQHMTFDELVGELIPSLCPNSTLIIASEIDKQTAIEKQKPHTMYNIV